MLDPYTISDHREAIELKPPTKISLSLVLRGRRTDGYHEIHTIKATTDLHDDLTIRLTHSPGINLHCSGEHCPSGEQNLLWLATEKLAHHAGITPALEIRLHKRIPAGAGLGGASSDAAACLLGLNRLWQLHLSRVELTRMAARLGPEVPFFLHAPVALCTGRGDVVCSLPHRCNRSVVLILPNLSVSTAEVCRHYKYDNDRIQDSMRLVHYFLRLGDLDGLVIQGINSLEDTCMELFEPLRQLRCRIENLGIGPLHISGSGSCLFATSASSEQTVKWAEQLQAHNFARVCTAHFAHQTEPFLAEQPIEI